MQTGDADAIEAYKKSPTAETLVQMGALIIDHGIPEQLMETLLKIVCPFLQNWKGIYHPKFFLVSGPPGSGKTTLVDALWQLIPT